MTMTKSETDWLQAYVDAKFEAINRRLDDIENKRIETLGVLRDATREAKDTLDQKLQDLNHLQRKMEVDRTSFVTKEQLMAMSDKLFARLTAIMVIIVMITQVIVHMFWK